MLDIVDARAPVKVYFKDYIRNGLGCGMNSRIDFLLDTGFEGGMDLVGVCIGPSSRSKFMYG